MRGNDLAEAPHQVTVGGELAITGELHSKALEIATVLDEQRLARITADEKTFGGKPVVRGSRIPVELVLSLLAQGARHTEILDDYPNLVEEDLLACLAYARAVVGRDSLEPIEVGGD